MSGEISPDLSPLLSENKFQHIYHRKVKAKKKNLEKSGAKLDESSTQAGDFSVLPELRTRSRPLSALYVTYGASSLSSLQNDQGWSVVMHETDTQAGWVVSLPSLINNSCRETNTGQLLKRLYVGRVWCTGTCVCRRSLHRWFWLQCPNSHFFFFQNSGNKRFWRRRKRSELNASPLC